MPWWNQEAWKLLKRFAQFTKNATCAVIPHTYLMVDDWNCIALRMASIEADIVAVWYSRLVLLRRCPCNLVIKPAGREYTCVHCSINNINNCRWFSSASIMCRQLFSANASRLYYNNTRIEQANYQFITNLKRSYLTIYKKYYLYFSAQCDECFGV